MADEELELGPARSSAEIPVSSAEATLFLEAVDEVLRLCPAEDVFRILEGVDRHVARRRVIESLKEQHP